MGGVESRLDAVSDRPEPTAREYHTGQCEAWRVTVGQKCVVTEKTTPNGQELPADCVRHAFAAAAAACSRNLERCQSSTTSTALTKTAARIMLDRKYVSERKGFPPAQAGF